MKGKKDNLKKPGTQKEPGYFNSPCLPLHSESEKRGSRSLQVGRGFLSHFDYSISELENIHNCLASVQSQIDKSVEYLLRCKNANKHKA